MPDIENGRNGNLRFSAKRINFVKFSITKIFSVLILLN